MFCDMEGFTSLSNKLEPEEAYSIIVKVYEILYMVMKARLTR
jgi:class 3 adenylate cyclase